MTRLPLIHAGLLAALLPGWAIAAGINDTGITQCANATQNNLTCPQTGFPSQDAETGRDAQADLQKIGSGSAGFDFTKLDASGHPLPADATSWDCVRDNVTGLIWEIKTNDSGLRDKDWRYTWCNPNSSTNGGDAGICDTGAGVGRDDCFNNARCDTEKYVADVNALSPALCGYTDWRMPTREELRGIVDYSRFKPAIDADYFPWTISYKYWSASPIAPDAGYAWVVGFSYGDDYATGKSFDSAVRLVRGGQPLALETTPTSDFILDDVNGAAYHKKTGLTWKRCTERQSWDSINKTCTGAAGEYAYTWPAALSLANGDWRLPNLKELASIVEQRNAYPAINTTVFPNSPYLFWSASPDARAGYAWAVDFSGGYNAIYDKEDYNLAVRLVRGGQYYYTVTATAGPNGSIAPAVRIVSRGATATFILTPDTGYTATATGCGGALKGNTYYTTGPITAHCTVTVNFVLPMETAPTTTGGDSFSVMNHASRILAYTTGLNSLCQLGAGSNSSTAQVRPQASFFRRIFPVRVYWRSRRPSQSPATVAPLAADIPDFIALASATAHTIALRRDGTVWAWGDNAKGQLGDGTTNLACEPIPVLSDSSGAPLTGVIAIAAGRDHSVAVKSDGTVWTWGDNTYGQLGDNSFSTTQRYYPVQVVTGDHPNISPLTGVKAVAASDVHTIALKTDGTVWAWGNNDSGQLGFGHTATRRTAAPVLGLNDVQAITARGTASSPRNIALRSDGSLWGWGDNTDCELGETATALGAAVLTPMSLPNLSHLGVSVKSIAQGDQHGIAWTPDDTAWTWGRNNQGQLGDGTTTIQCAPIPVPGVSAVETVGAGAEHTVVTTNYGWVWGWGGNDEGQLGVGDTNARLTPTQMWGEDGVGFLNLKVDPTASPGDVNGDGKIDALDVVAVINAVLGIQWSPAADVTGDSAVNALDVVFVINRVLGL